MPRLIVVSGAEVGAEFSFTKSVIAGRDKACELCLRSPSISRQHARIELRGEQWFVVDLGSSNGIFIAGERVSESVLGDGQFLRLGEVELRFRKSLAAAAEKPATKEDAPSVARAPQAPQEEIELEGDWSEAVLPTANVPKQSSATKPAMAAAKVSPAVPRSANQAQAELLGALAPKTAQASQALAGRILQYHKRTGRAGLFGADFAQQPTWLRWTALTLVSALAVALAWGSFLLTRSLRE